MPEFFDGVRRLGWPAWHCWMLTKRSGLHGLRLGAGENGDEFC